MYWQNKFTFQSSGRGTYEITRNVEEMIRDSGVQQGLCHLFIQHTSASLIISENADPAVHVDLETFMSKLSPDGDPMFTHRAEGNDDMPAHIRSVLTQTELNVPVSNGGSGLGVWQGIYLWEHRTSPHQRQIIVTIHGQ
ncbi:MAG: YjbQ family protein [Gammaproteobacteria bacterium]|nr:MAG: YjbQ family protein [Gammaproteobacteria bacterium]